MKLLYLSVLITLLFSCGKEKSVVNGIDQHSFDESIALMERELPSDQEPKLKEAIQIIYTFDTHQDTEELRWSRTRQLLNMKNADEIFTQAENTALRKGIDWDRNSLGLLDVSLLQTEKSPTADPTENQGNPQLEQVDNIQIFTKNLDQNQDGITDGVMIFVDVRDKTGKSIEFDQADINATFDVFQNNQKTYSKTQRIQSSNVGKPALNRGVVLSFNAFMSEVIKGNEVDLSVKLVTPYSYLTAEKNHFTLPLTQYLEYRRVSQEDINIQKKEAQNVVQQFLQYIGEGNLESAHMLSANPEWRLFKTFESKDLGFGAVKGVEIKNIKLTRYQYETGKAEVEAQYIFAIKSDSLSLHKAYSLQKINNDWKITNTRKIN